MVFYRNLAAVALVAVASCAYRPEIPHRSCGDLVDPGDLSIRHATHSRYAVDVGGTTATLFRLDPEAVGMCGLGLHGLGVVSVEPGSFAALLGIREGDRLWRHAEIYPGKIIVIDRWEGNLNTNITLDIRYVPDR